MNFTEVSIIDVVKDRVALVKRGKNYYCSCPFHNEKTPSMVLYPETNSYYCFGCHESGNSLKFIEKFDNVNNFQAKQILITSYGAVNEIEESRSEKEQKLLDFLTFSNVYLNSNFNTISKSANDYLSKRGINEDTIRYFGIGVVQDDISPSTGFFKNREFYPEFEKTLLLFKRDQIIKTSLSERIIFPIYDVHGNIVFFGGRSFNGAEPKYIYSENTSNISKSDYIYNMNNVDMKKDLIVTEGVFDVWALFQNGEKNSVSILGSSFSEKQIDTLERYKKSIYLALDGDDAGIDGTIKLLNNNSKIRNNSYVVELDGMDPYDYYITENKSNIKQLAIESNIYLINHFMKSSPKSTVLDKINLTNKIFKIIFESKNFNSEYIHLLASELKIKRDELEKKYIEYSQENIMDYDKLLPLKNDYYYIESGRNVFLVKRVSGKSIKNNSLFKLLIKAIDVDELNRQIDNLDSYEMKSGNNICVFTSNQISEVVKMVEGWESKNATK